MDDFSEPIHIDAEGKQYRVRLSSGAIYTFRPSTKEFVALCDKSKWPAVAKKLGLRFVGNRRLMTKRKRKVVKK